MGDLITTKQQDVNSFIVLSKQLSINCYWQMCEYGNNEVPYSKLIALVRERINRFFADWHFQ